MEWRSSHALSRTGTMRFVFPRSSTSILKAFQWLGSSLCWACLAAQAIEPVKATDPRSNQVRHWAYQTPRRPNPPEVRGGAGNPIDAFVQSKLTSEGIDPSPQASLETLIRRVTRDLTGLPPTPEEVEAFRRDLLPGAYERLVDRLLASPRFGERMAWDWLEAARYADSNGYQGDGERTMWPWRDWVIRAVNQNLPFDQFTQWQLAGDLLPQPTLDNRIATGFLRNHMINGEGGVFPKCRHPAKVPGALLFRHFELSSPSPGGIPPEYQVL